MMEVLMLWANTSTALLLSNCLKIHVKISLKLKYKAYNTGVVGVVVSSLAQHHGNRGSIPGSSIQAVRIHVQNGCPVYLRQLMQPHKSPTGLLPTAELKDRQKKQNHKIIARLQHRKANLSLWEKTYRIDLPNGSDTIDYFFTMYI